MALGSLSAKDVVTGCFAERHKWCPPRRTVLDGKLQSSSEKGDRAFLGVERFSLFHPKAVYSTSPNSAKIRSACAAIDFPSMCHLAAP